MTTHTDRKDVIASVENRLQLAVTISIFYPALVYTLFKFAGSTEQQVDTMQLDVFVQVGLYLLSYCFYQLCKNNISDKQLRRIDWAALIAIASYIFPTLAIAIGKDGPFQWYVALPFVASLLIVATMPAIILGMTLLPVIWNYFWKQVTG